MTFAQEQGDRLAARMEAVAGELRERIAAKTGGTVDPAHVRILRRELQAAVAVAALAMVPTDFASLAAILTREPGWLDTEVGEVDRSQRTITIAVLMREALAEAIASTTGQKQYRVFVDQFDGMDFSAVVEALRETLVDVRSVDPRTADALEGECDSQSSKTVPNVRSLLPGIGNARTALTKASRAGDRNKSRTARILSELADYIDLRGWHLDKTHVPPTGPRP